MTIPDGVTSIGEGAFSGCSAALFDTTAIPGVRLVDGWAVGYVGEPSGDLNDWDGAAKLTPAVEVLATDSDGKMTFAVTPGDGTAPSAFLRLRK